MNRRHFLTAAAAGAASLALTKASQAASKPNILFVAVDDMRPFLACYGDPNAITPNFDRLAQRSVRFTNAQCTAPACGPSRAAIMTGQLPTNTGIYEFQDWLDRPEFAKIQTLPQFFKENGYNTFGAGKIHHGDATYTLDNNHREWTETNWETEKKYPYIPEIKQADKVWWGSPDTDKTMAAPSDTPIDEIKDTVNANFGVKILGRDHEKPFFLGVGFHRPHMAWVSPRKFWDMYDPDKLILPEVKDDDLADVPWPGRMNARLGDDYSIRTRGVRSQIIRGYYACISYVDSLVGRLLDALDASPYKDNTIIALWADHGWHLGEKRSYRKFSLWEEATRTPFMMLDPRHTESAGKTCTRPVTLHYLYPTLAELCGLEAPERLDGVSMAPLLADPETPWDRPAITVWGRGDYSLRTERWRYTRYFEGSEELYDHTNDPHEWTNAADNPEYAEVKERLAKWFPKTSVPNLEPTKLHSMADEDYPDMEKFKKSWASFQEKMPVPLE